MELDEAIISRQSIKSYKDKDVDNKIIGEILTSAINAPSSGNIQNWHFIIVRDQEKRNNIATSCLKQYWMNEAPVHIVVCYDERNIKMLYPKMYEEFSLQNTSIVATLILLKATDLGIGSCWVSVFDPGAISSILKLPEHIKPSVIITLGYPRVKPKKTTRNPAFNLVSFEEYRKAHPKHIPTLEKVQNKLQKAVKGRLRR